MGHNNNSFGQQIAQGAVGGAIGIGLGAISNELQYGMQKKLQKLQIQGQQQMADYNYQKQLDMWKATNYGAQVEQLKEAGLNPGLLYGMSGGGSATVGHQGGQVTGGQATNHGAMAMQLGQATAQLGLLKAQKENIEANTEKTKVETEKTAGVDTQKTKEEITGLQLSNKYQQASLEDRIDMIDTEANRAIVELDRASTQLGLDRATVLQRADIIRQQAIGEALKNVLTQAQTRNTNKDTEKKGKEIEKIDIDIKLTDQQIRTMAQQIMINWDELSLKSRRQQMEELIAAEYGEIMPRDLINVLSEAVDGILRSRK